MLLEMSFECHSMLTLQLCKELLEQTYPQRKFLTGSEILLESISEEGDYLWFVLMQSRVRGIFVKMDAMVTATYVLTRHLFLLTYFCVFSLLLVFVFRSIPLLSLLFACSCVLNIYFSVVTLRQRRVLIDNVRALLTN